MSFCDLSNALAALTILLDGGAVEYQWSSADSLAVDPVPVHAGRWWEVGSTPFEGARIKEWRPHWSILHKSHAEDAALYGSEEEKWKHNPVLHLD